MKRSNLWILILMIAGVGLVSSEFQPKSIIVNPYTLTKEQTIKAAAPSVRVYLAAKAVSQDSPISFDEFIKCAREETGFKDLFQSNYTHLQISRAEAQGSWQVRVCAARDVWGDSIANMSDKQVKYKLLTDIEWNAETAMRYAKKMYKMYNGRKSEAFAAYNRGPANVHDKSDVNRYARNITD